MPATFSIRTFSSCSANVVRKVKLYICVCVDTQSQCVLRKINTNVVYFSCFLGYHVLRYILRFASQSAKGVHCCSVEQGYAILLQHGLNTKIREVMFYLNMFYLNITHGINAVK